MYHITFADVLSDMFESKLYDIVGENPTVDSVLNAVYHLYTVYLNKWGFNDYAELSLIGETCAEADYFQGNKNVLYDFIVECANTVYPHFEEV